MYKRYYLVTLQNRGFYTKLECEQPFTIEEGLKMLAEKYPDAVNIINVNSQKAEIFLGLGEK